MATLLTPLGQGGVIPASSGFLPVHDKRKTSANFLTSNYIIGNIKQINTAMLLYKSNSYDYLSLLG